MRELIAKLKSHHQRAVEVSINSIDLREFCPLLLTAAFDGSKLIFHVSPSLDFFCKLLHLQRGRESFLLQSELCGLTVEHASIIGYCEILIFLTSKLVFAGKSAGGA